MCKLYPVFGVGQLCDALVQVAAVLVNAAGTPVACHCAEDWGLPVQHSDCPVDCIHVYLSHLHVAVAVTDGRP
jgi:hypothetical protein